MRPGRLIAVTALVTLAAAVAVLWALPSATDFSTSNPRWNGLRDAAERHGLTPLASLRALPPGAGAVLVLIPSSPPAEDGLNRLWAFLSEGGTLVLTDDFGAANQVLKDLGLRSRLGGEPLADGLFHYKTPAFPRITDITPSPVTSGVGELVLNHATIISPLGELRAVARSSAASFLDVNGNGRRDPGEAAGPFPVVAAGEVGGGRLVLVSDASLLLNAMLPLGDNRRFAEAIARLGGGVTQMLLDESTLTRRPLDVAKTILRDAGIGVISPLLAFAISAAALSVPLVLLLRPARR